MRVPVLVTLPTQETLRESASAFRAKRVPTRDFAKTAMPPGIQLDTAFPAVPIGKGGLFETAASHEPEKSENFTVRGFVEIFVAGHIATQRGRMDGPGIPQLPQQAPTFFE